MNILLTEIYHAQSSAICSFVLVSWFVFLYIFTLNITRRSCTYLGTKYQMNARYFSTQIYIHFSQIEKKYLFQQINPCGIEIIQN